MSGFIRELLASAVRFLHAGAGAIWRTVEDKLRDTTDMKDWGAKCDGITDDWAKAQACINASVGKTVRITGVLGLSKPLEIKNGVNVVCEGEIKALPGFVGAQLVTTDTVESYKGGVISKLRLNGNGKNIKGLVVRLAQTSYITETYVSGCLDDGIVVQAGYEVFISKWQVLGAAAGMVPNSAGLRVLTSDCHFIDGVPTLYPIGVAVAGGNNRFTRIHPWGVYTPGSTPMLHGFYVQGENNSFSQCMADSPDLADRSAAPSLANGGYGFFIDEAYNGISTRLSQCSVFVLGHANAPQGKLYAVHVGKVGCDLDVTWIDRNATSAANPTSKIEYATGTVRNQTRITGGNLIAVRSRADDITTFTPTLSAGGDASGFTYFAGRQNGRMTHSGAFVSANIQIRLTSKGTGAGAVAIEGLPLKMAGLGNNQRCLGIAQITNPFLATQGCYIQQYDNKIYILKQDGTLMQNADLAINTELYVHISYEWTAT